MVEFFDIIQPTHLKKSQFKIRISCYSQKSCHTLPGHVSHAPMFLFCVSFSLGPFNLCIYLSYTIDNHKTNKLKYDIQSSINVH